VDLINTLRIILEQSSEWNWALYVTFVDSKKAFHSLKRRYLWKVLQQYGLPGKILNLIKKMYRDYECKVILYMKGNWQKLPSVQWSAAEMCFVSDLIPFSKSSPATCHGGA
jgi:hypothetical protein